MTMQAIEIRGTGGADVLHLTKRAVPKPAPQEVRIKLAYSGVNRPDVLQRQGLYAPPKDASDILGLEGAGIIDSVGAGVSESLIGTKVCALLPGGGYAEYATAPATHCLPIPEGLNAKQAACLPETFFTCWSNLVMRGELSGGQRILIHGGSSGIGTTAIQLASAIGARVFTTAGTEAKCAACLALGAEQSINYKTDDFADILKREGGADFILDMVGGGYLARNLKALAPDGKIVQIAFLGGPKSEANFAPMMMQRQTITGSTLRAQSTRAKGKIAQELLKSVWPLLETGRIAPVLDKSFPLADVQGAHRYMESGAHIGKIVLEINPELM